MSAPSPNSALDGVLLDGAGRRVAADAWCFLEDDQGIEACADIVLSLDRLEEMAEQLAGRNGRVGVLLRAGEDVERLEPFLAQLALVAIEFPAFKDGHGLSAARLLRGRYGFKGELRAVGAVLEDQLFFMLRCGFDGFALRHRDPEAAFAKAAATFTHSYQRASDRRETIAALRGREANSDEHDRG